jgi:hypothetical protein
MSRYYVTIITVSDRARQLIRNPQTFYKAVHRALGFKEQAPNVLRSTKNLLLNSKIGIFALKLQKMEDFFHKCEDTITIHKTSIANFNSASSGYSWDIVFSKLGELLDQQLIIENYEKFIRTITNSTHSDGLHTSVDANGRRRNNNFAENIVGGFLNAFALILGLAKIIPRKLLEQSTRKFKDFNDFKETVKKITRKNIKIILGFSKLELSLFFKLLGILGDNHIDYKLNYVYDIDPAYFDFDKISNPTQLLPLKSLSRTLIDGANSDGTMSAYGHTFKIDNSMPVLGCPAIYIRTKDGKKNMIEFYSDLICDVLDQTIFENLDKWFQLKPANLDKNISK